MLKYCQRIHAELPALLVGVLLAFRPRAGGWLPSTHDGLRLRRGFRLIRKCTTIFRFNRAATRVSTL